MAEQEAKTFLERLEAGSDTYLTVAELTLVLILAAAVAILAVLTLAWIVWVPCLQALEQRLMHVLSGLNDNWRACLILLVPLFYRTTRKFIGRIRRLPGGVEADAEDEKAKPEITPKRPNPPVGERK